MEAADTGQPRIGDTRDVIAVSCYGDLERARKDFDELTRQIKKEHFQVRESVLLGKNADGTPTVLDTSSGHHGRTGASVGAGMGFLIGVLTMRHDIAEKLAEATGVVITLATAYDEQWARRALSGASAYMTVPYPESTIASLEEAVMKAMSGLGSGAQA